MYVQLGKELLDAEQHMINGPYNPFLISQEEARQRVVDAMHPDSQAPVLVEIIRRNEE